MSFACPHFDPVHNFCQRCLAACVPGRPGCVLAKNSTFHVPASERLPEKRNTLDPTVPQQTD